MKQTLSSRLIKAGWSESRRFHPGYTVSLGGKIYTVTDANPASSRRSGMTHTEQLLIQHKPKRTPMRRIVANTKEGRQITSGGGQRFYPELVPKQISDWNAKVEADKKLKAAEKARKGAYGS